jgi:hypothetical protein
MPREMRSLSLTLLLAEGANMPRHSTRGSRSE